MERKQKLFLTLIYTVLLISVISFGFILGCENNNTYPENHNNKIVKNKNKSRLQIKQELLKEHIQKLTSKEFRGRRAGTEGEAEAALYLSKKLKDAGIEPLGVRNTYFQAFPLPLTDLKIENKRTVFYIKESDEKLIGDNVLGVIKSTTNPKEYIILSAHYDHLGVWDGKLYPGANDNASGVGTVLEIARILAKERYRLPYSVIIAFWSGEEMGLIGSNYFTNHPTIDLTKIKLVINLDSIGTGSKNNFILWGDNSSGVVNSLFEKWSKWENCKIIHQNSLNNTSDHKSFSKIKIPAVTVLAENWLEGNHSSLDNVYILNYNKISFLAQKILDFLCSYELEDVLEAKK